ncbi:MAG: APC family permease [Nitrospinae bacterium]|nr:APC family permease [Nitrospinota bacterium]
MPMSLKTFLIGQPIDSVKEKRERLNKITGLAVFSSDAISSVAYATEEMLIPLAMLGLMAVHFSIQISAAIIALIVIVALSYTQTIRAYPNGGGSYIVARENLGEKTGLVAAAALMIDYVLTVIVSISAGVAAITSAFPSLSLHTVLLCLLSLLIIIVVNLRGLRESGAIFSGPVYVFIGSLLLLVAVGAYKFHGGMVKPQNVFVAGALDAVPTFIILRAFASGCTALTGIEAVANGVKAFQAPESRNAAITVTWMAAILGVLFIGISYDAYVYGILPKDGETVVSQLASAVFGIGPIYYVIQFATFFILVLAANTAFADFPRLSSILAADSFFPRQLASLGDKLVFSNGIILLGVFSAVLLVVFEGDTHLMIPLYTIGVFIAFTLSQAGMVVHWFKKREKWWIFSMTMNGVGAIATFLVFLVVSYSKFVLGAWIALAAVPAIIFFMHKIHTHYKSISEQLAPRELSSASEYAHHSVIIPIGGVNKAVINSIRYAKAISNDVTAIYVCLDTSKATITKELWDKFGMKVPLLVLDSPYRSIIEPVVDYIEEVRKDYKNGVITVILPELVPSRWWEHLLHNQTALLLKGILLFKKGVVSTSVPYQFE